MTNATTPASLPAAVKAVGTFPKLERAARAAVLAMGLPAIRHQQLANAHRAVSGVVSGADGFRHEFMGRAHAEMAQALSVAS